MVYELTEGFVRCHQSATCVVQYDVLLTLDVYLCQPVKPLIVNKICVWLTADSGLLNLFLFLY